MQVGIDRNHRVAVCLVEARRKRRFLAEVACEIDHAHARIACTRRDELIQCAVVATVVDADNLEADTFYVFEYRHNARKELFDRFALVVERNHQ